VPDDAIGVRVDCVPVVDRKSAAVGEHRTQATSGGFPDDLRARFLQTECFAVAWPERPAGAPVLSDVFEGLD
jgi:LmbE family N-acetylglucosaminyl deacetylase